jgi:hypothetical protein
MVRRAWMRGMGLVLAAHVLSAGCAPKPSQELFSPTEAQLKLRAFQTRTFDVKDRRVALRAVIAVLQDLGFIIERTNEPLGVVTAERFAEPNYNKIVGVTITVHAQEDGRMLIRANAILDNKPIEDPKVYQNFFASLERSLFVTKE